jgi:hypothetical protein
VLRLQTQIEEERRRALGKTRYSLKKIVSKGAYHPTGREGRLLDERGALLGRGGEAKTRSMRCR